MSAQLERRINRFCSLSQHHFAILCHIVCTFFLLKTEKEKQPPLAIRILSVRGIVYVGVHTFNFFVYQTWPRMGLYLYFYINIICFLLISS